MRTYNEANYIQECLELVFSQEYTDFEVIIVDSGSTDQTLDISKRFNVQIINIKKKDFTYGRALNIGCKKARGRYLVFISAHATPADKKWLGELIKNFRKETAAVYGRQIPRKDAAPLSKRMVEDSWKTRDRGRNIITSNANAAIRKSSWEETQFNEELEGGEDTLWAKKVKEKGLEISYSPKAAVYHSHNDNLKQFYERYFKDLYALISIYPKEYILRTLLDIPYNLIKDIMYITKNKNKPYWIAVSFFLVYIKTFAWVGAIFKQVVQDTKI